VRTPGDVAVLAALRIEAIATGGMVRLVGIGPGKAETSGCRLTNELTWAAADREPIALPRSPEVT